MFKCVFCNKHYESQKCLHKHYVKCSLEHNINVLKCESDLFEMMRQLLAMNKNLTERVKKLEQQSYRETKKLCVVKWLNENKKNNVNMKDFVKSLKFDEEHIEYVYKEGIIEGLAHILNEKLKDMNDVPLMCFERKSYELYVKDENKWEKIDDKEFKKYILSMQRKLLKLFRERNPVERLDTDEEHNTYNRRLRSICVDNFTRKIKNIKSEIYRKNKVNMNKLVKYDFVF